MTSPDLTPGGTVSQPATKAERRFFDLALIRSCGEIAESFLPQNLPARGPGSWEKNSAKLNADAFYLYKMAAAGWGNPDTVTALILAHIQHRRPDWNDGLPPPVEAAIRGTLSRAWAAAQRNPRPPLAGTPLPPRQGHE